MRVMPPARLAGLGAAAALVALTSCGGGHPAAGRSPSPAGSSRIPATSPGPGTATPGNGVSEPSPTPTTPTGGLTPVPSRITVSQPPVPFTSTGNLTGGVSVTVAKVASATSGGQGPGQISGQPALAFTLSMSNGSTKALDLNQVIVGLTYGTAATPGVPDNGSPSAPLAGSLAVGARASGTYVFTIPADQRADVVLTVSATTARPTVVFSGRP